MGLGARTGLLAVVAVSMGWSGPAAAQDRAMLDGLADRQALATATALQAQHKYRPLCDNVPPGFARCYLRARVEDDGTTIHTDASPVGLGATDIAAAYNLPKTGGNGKIVALIDWADDASAESDLAAYRAQYGLPACTTANGCFKKVDQNGGTSYPAAVSCAGNQTASAGEASLDIEMASAACPDCHIVLIEAVDSSPQNLAAALQTAVTLGAAAISNSYGGPEQGDAQMEPYYTHAGIIIAAATGDQGYGAGYPATSAGVIAVGGTNLVKSASSRGWAETVWNDQSGGTGSGCSAEIAKPAWQKDPTCAKRMEADVSAAAEGTDGIAEVCGGQWIPVVGTSAATPIVAAALLVTGQGAGFTPAWVYSHTGDFYDITSGSNGTCTTPYFCNAAVGFDGPTGWGTPNGALISGSGSSSGSSSGGGSSGSSSGSSSGGSSSGGSSSGGSSGGSSGSGSSGGGSSGGSGGSGSTSSGSSSGNGLIADGGAANGDNVGWSPETPAAGCGCTVVDAGEGFGALAVAAGVMLGTGLRRRRRAR